MKKTKVLILGAAGRDFHNFNVFFRNNHQFEVVAFTATQIPGIEDRVYPEELAGKLYPKGIKIYPETMLEELIKKYDIDVCVLSYSDLKHETVMHLASRVLAAGADYWLLGPKSTMLKTKTPVVSVCAVRTGCGKSQTTLKVVKILKEMGKKIVSIRHPMPYGDLTKMAVQRFAAYKDLDKEKCTIEEREEYEPHIDLGAVIYSGIDYEKILHQAEKEADIIVWDGGNNDFPFYKADLEIVVVDPLRAGHELMYHPGETNLRRADVIVINKEDTAAFEQINTLRENIAEVNPKAIVIDAASILLVDQPKKLKGKRVLVIEDGPTVTHGEMSIGAAYVAAKKFGAAEIVSPYPYAVKSIKETYEKYPHVQEVLPAMGYGKKQIEDLEETINRMPVDLVIVGTPIDLRRIMKIKIPAVRVKYELQELGKPDLSDVLREKFK
uniref:GTPase n=1 Tax=candidate division CPR3 bacterium TaxID=2268181 RepID=A0A7C4QXL0_UNCC3